MFIFKRSRRKKNKGKKEIERKKKPFSKKFLIAFYQIASTLDQLNDITINDRHFKKMNENKVKRLQLINEEGKQLRIASVENWPVVVVYVELISNINHDVNRAQFSWYQWHTHTHTAVNETNDI